MRLYLRCVLVNQVMLAGLILFAGSILLTVFLFNHLRALAQYAGVEWVTVGILAPFITGFMLMIAANCARDTVLEYRRVMNVLQAGHRAKVENAHYCNRVGLELAERDYSNRVRP